ncbi:unnamed protein product [Owenia fusiformis]|uniref:Uncharacterized protein n=1 Tax=Owenia fusiformis TaxID=6347 RepID=A0A8S4PY00_OWEFU|nr:unnamed protein product [Owenia fusiformis]
MDVKSLLQSLAILLCLAMVEGLRCHTCQWSISIPDENCRSNPEQVPVQACSRRYKRPVCISSVTYYFPPSGPKSANFISRGCYNGTKDCQDKCKPHPKDPTCTRCCEEDECNYVFMGSSMIRGTWIYIIGLSGLTCYLLDIKL